MSWNRIGLITLFDLRHSMLKAKGLIFLVPFFLFWFLILREVDEDVSGWFQSMEGFALMSAWFNIDMARKLFVQHPPILSAFLIISLMFAPVFAILAGNDQFSSDLSEGYYRFLSTRCKRIEIFLGKYLSSLGLMTVALVIIGIASLALSSYYEDYSFTTVSSYCLKIVLVLFLYHAALLAYMSIISTTIRSPLGSLLLGGIAYVGLLFSGFVTNKMVGDTEVFSYILPGALKPLLLDVGGATWAWATFALLIYTISYGLLAWVIFKHRNF